MGKTDTTVLFRLEDGPFIREKGKWFRRGNGETVFALRTFFPFEVNLGKFTLHGRPGDYVVYCLHHNRIWPASAEFVSENYKEVT